MKIFQFFFQVDVHAGLLHDAVLQWAYGVNKTLQKGGDYNDGVSVASNITNMTYPGNYNSFVKKSSWSRETVLKFSGSYSLYDINIRLKLQICI